MGIAGFYRQWIAKTYQKQWIDRLHLGQSYIYKFDTLLVDFNGIIHHAHEGVYTKWLEHRDTKRSETKMIEESRDVEPTEQEKLLVINPKIREKIARRLEKICRLAEPQREVVICVDGSAPFAKQMQQRKRRFEACGGVRDLNEITPGTTFMNSLNHFLHQWARSQKSLKYRIIISDSDSPGEGEHKLMNYLRYYIDRRNTVCLVGEDSDLIMLGILNRRCVRSIHVLHATHNDRKVFDLVDVSEIGEQWSRALTVDAGVAVLLSTVIGNDFLSSIPGFDSTTLTVARMLSLVQRFVRENKVRDIEDTFSNLHHFFRLLSEIEPENIVKCIRKGEKGWLDDSIIRDSLRPDGKLDIPLFKRKYYGISGVPVERLCKDYVKGLRWIYQYYTKDVPDWGWAYPHDWPPLVSDLAMLIPAYEHEEFPRTTPVEPLLQLCLVFPPASILRHLPPALNQIHLRPELREYFPETFEKCGIGKMRSYEKLLLIKRPPLELARKIFHELWPEKFTFSSSKVYDRRGVSSIDL